MQNINLFIFLLFSLTVVISCGEPNDPESIVAAQEVAGHKIITKYGTTGNAQDVIKHGDLLYLAQGEGGLIVIDALNPESPVTIGRSNEEVRGYSHRIAIKDNAAYLSAAGFGVNVLDISNPVTPLVTVSNLAMKPARSVFVFDDYLLVPVSELGVKIAELSFPTHPDVRGSVYTEGFARGIDISADSTLLFVVSGEIGLTVFDVTNFFNGWGNYPKKGETYLSGYAESIIVNDEQSLAYIACGGAGLQIVNYSDLTDIKVVSTLDVNGYAGDLEVIDNIVYLSSGKGGLHMIDVSDSTDPFLVGTFYVDEANGIDYDENYIYLADENDGLIIISRP